MEYDIFCYRTLLRSSPTKIAYNFSYDQPNVFEKSQIGGC